LIIINQTLERAFTDLISTSIERQELDISPLAESYVVELVTSFVYATHVVHEGMYLNELVRKALDSEGRIRRVYLRTAGDIALFITGVLPDSLESRRTWFSLGDYIDIGQKAYDHINTDVFDELAVIFPEMVEVLNDVSVNIKLTSTDLIRYIKRRSYIDVRTTRR